MPTPTRAAQAPDRPNDPPLPDDDRDHDFPEDGPDGIPDTPGTEPEPIPIRDPTPEGQPVGPYIA